MIIDLFGGPGGWDEGLRLLGVPDDEVTGVEWDPSACATARAAGHPRLNDNDEGTADVTVVDPARFAGAVGVIASPPCGPFSKAGLRGGLTDLDRIIRHLRDVQHAGRWISYDDLDDWADDRSPLILEPVRWVSVIRPRWVALEQVPDALPVWAVVAEWLAEQGYEVTVGELSSEQYGVPQTRRRAILKARRDGRPAVLPAPTHARYVPGRRKAPQPDALFDEPERQRIVLPADRRLLPWVSMADALGWTGNADQRPARTMCGDRSPRWAYGDGAGSYDTGWTLETEQTSERAGGRREPITRDDDQPAPALVANADRWTLKPSAQSNATASAMWALTRSLDEPAGTVDWVRTGNKSAAAGGETVPYEIDPNERPSPTMTRNGKSWTGGTLHTNVDQREDGTRQTRPVDEPAPTLSTKSGGQWTVDRPATTVQGDARIWPPGHKASDQAEQDSGQYGDRAGTDAVRITVQQAGILQSFPADYPWQGTKTAQFRQVGDAVPPLLAAAVLADLVGGA